MINIALSPREHPFIIPFGTKPESGEQFVHVDTIEHQFCHAASSSKNDLPRSTARHGSGQ